MSYRFEDKFQAGPGFQPNDFPHEELAALSIISRDLIHDGASTQGYHVKSRMNKK